MPSHGIFEWWHLMNCWLTSNMGQGRCGSRSQRRGRYHCEGGSGGGIPAEYLTIHFLSSIGMCWSLVLVGFGLIRFWYWPRLHEQQATSGWGRQGSFNKPGERTTLGIIESDVLSWLSPHCRGICSSRLPLTACYTVGIRAGHMRPAQPIAYSHELHARPYETWMSNIVHTAAF